MFRTDFLIFVGLVVLSQTTLAESIPLMIPHSGTVSSKGAPFNGQGHFRFAIINGDLACQSTSPIAPCKSVWSSDGTSSTGEMPDNAMTIPVSNGQFSVKLGGTSPLNETVATQMPALSVGVFNTPTTYLRVWFDDGSNGPQLLSPDRQLVAVPYAYRAQVAEKVTGTNGILSVDAQGHFSRDGLSQCCAPADPVTGSGLQDFTLSLGEYTRKNDGSGAINTGRRATLQFHNGAEAEGFIRLASGGASQPMTTLGTPAPNSLPLTSRRFIFGSYQTPISGEFTGDVSAGAGSSLIAYDATGNLYARLIHTNNGNLHLDPIGGGNSYINWYGGTELHVGNGVANYGPVFANSFNVASSRKLKTDISENRYGLAEVLKLEPVNYLYLNDPTRRRHIGLIAEDVDPIIPEVVQHDDQGQASGIDYSKLTVVLINAVKELKQQNDDLRREVEALRQTK